MIAQPLPKLNHTIYSVYGYVWSGFDWQNTVCYCYSSICTAFVPGPTYNTLGYNQARTFLWDHSH